MQHYDENYCGKCKHKVVTMSRAPQTVCNYEHECFANDRCKFEEIEEEEESEDVPIKKNTTKLDKEQRRYIIGSLVGLLLLVFMLFAQLAVIVYTVVFAVAHPNMGFGQVLLNTWDKLAIIIGLYLAIQVIALFIKTKNK